MSFTNLDKIYPLHQRCINYSLENKCCSLLYYNPCGWSLDDFQKICDGRYAPVICAHSVSINLTQNDIDNSRKEVRRIRKELGLL